MLIRYDTVFIDLLPPCYSRPKLFCFQTSSVLKIPWQRLHRELLQLTTSAGIIRRPRIHTESYSKKPVQRASAKEGLARRDVREGAGRGWRGSGQVGERSKSPPSPLLRPLLRSTEISMRKTHSRRSPTCVTLIFLRVTLWWKAMINKGRLTLASERLVGACWFTNLQINIPNWYYELRINFMSVLSFWYMQ